MLNDFLHRALSSTNVPSQLEPTGLDRADGKRHDGINMILWPNGRLLVWDATCVDTSHLAMCSNLPGRADQGRENGAG